MKICFVLPGSSPTPTGGVKNIYEHANRLAEKGHGVTILHTAYVTRRSGVRGMARAFASYLLNLVGAMHWRPDRWFRVDPRIEMRWVPAPACSFVPEGDAVIATAWQTAEWVRDYPASKGAKFYFAMDFERFMEAASPLRERIAATHTANLRTMVISPAGAEMVVASGGRPPCFVPCALDFSVYRLENAVDDPKRGMIGFPWRPEPHKAALDAVTALALARARTGFAGTVWCFGASRPAELPEWIEFYARPSDAELARLYNRTSIFVMSSRYEGWGLPGSEAMACGAALVSTDNGGVRAYAQHEVSALLTPVADPKALAAAVSSLIEDDGLRLRLAASGCERIRQFTWERSSADLERCLSAEL
jgi:glycosyltransferase involved in cell wall biosynthesis